jgi:hypothetical protein
VSRADDRVRPSVVATDRVVDAWNDRAAHDCACGGGWLDRCDRGLCRPRILSAAAWDRRCRARVVARGSRACVAHPVDGGTREPGPTRGGVPRSRAAARCLRGGGRRVHQGPRRDRALRRRLLSSARAGPASRGRARRAAASLERDGACGARRAVAWTRARDPHLDLGSARAVASRRCDRWRDGARDGCQRERDGAAANVSPARRCRCRGRSTPPCASWCSAGRCRLRWST